MPIQEDVVFAKIAVHNKLLSQREVGTCMKMVKKAAANGKSISLADVVLRNWLLSKKKVDKISSAVQYTITKARDKVHAQILQQKKFATTEQINAAIEIQREFFEQSKQSASILDILIRKDFFEREKADEIMREAEKQGEITVDELVYGEKETSAKSRVEKVGACKVTIRKISLPTGRKACCLEVSGSLDADSFAGLQRIIGEIVQKPGGEGKYVILNLENVDYVSSSGVGVILSANKDISTKGGILMLANVKEEVKDLMTLVGLDSALGFYTMDEALKKIEKEK